MARHAALPGAEGTEWRKPIRDSLLVMGAVTVVISILLGGYASGFGNPKPHNIPVAVSAPASVRAALDASPALEVHAADAADARRMVEDRDVYGALLFTTPGALTVVIASGGGHSVASALTTIGQGVAAKDKLSVRIDDLAPLDPHNPNGTFEFYCIVFLTIGAALGATMLGRVLGAVQDVGHLARRTLAIAVLSALLAGAAVVLTDPVFGALTGHGGYLFLALWCYTLAIGLITSGVSALLGSFAGLALTLAFTVLGNTSAGGAVGRPLLNSFFSALNPIVPHGAGMSIVRGVQYFDGRGIADGVLCLSIWAAVGLVMHLVFAIRRGKQTAPAGKHEAASAADAFDPGSAVAV